MKRTALTATVAILLAACGDEQAAMERPGPSSGLGGSKTFGELTAAEVSLICDWTAGCFGGYGRTKSCPETGVTMSSAASRESCVASWSAAASMPESCRMMTVAEYEGCLYTVECPQLWLASTCSAVRSCMLDMMVGGG